MSVIDRRKRRDRRTGLLIRGTSVLVLLLIAGMFIQLVSAALPLLGQRTLQPLEASELDMEGSQREARPAWVPTEETNVRWYESGQQRVWLVLNESGDVVGERQLANEDPSYWQNKPLEFQNRVLSADFVDISAGGNWLIMLSRAGQFALTSLRDTQGQSSTYLTGKLPEHTSVVAMPGRRSWLLVNTRSITQTHLVTRQGQPVLEVLRALSMPEEVKLVVPGPASQLLAVLTTSDVLQVWNVTDAELLASAPVASGMRSMAWPSSSSLVLENAAGVRQHFGFVGLDTIAGYQRLFGEVHYEGYRDASRIWQPGSSAAGYEAKFGLVPLVIGTVKAALVALLMALPLAVGSAIFVGFFMSSALRNRIKPTIELIAAFPTVVVGAVAALWLGPVFMTVVVELVTAMVLIPIGVVLLAFAWRRHPVSRQTGRYLPKVPFILLPVVLVFGAIGLLLGHWFESSLLGGSFTDWIDQRYGIISQQRNALIVGVALGFAIIPTIFSVAEDAIYAVPKSAASGSLALGATQWQSFRDVVLPVAMPGVLSAVMLGFGRAMGETMILLLVAGNAPLDSWSLLESLRSISATLAIELTESPVGSVYYRVLFFASLLLFFLTFTFNTVAQLLKRHLKRQFGLDL